MKERKFLTQVTSIINDKDLIIENSDDPQKLYFKNSTILHQHDGIVKQGILKKIANTFSLKSYAEIIRKTIYEFNKKYHFKVIKIDGKTKSNMWGKYQDDYFIKYESDQENVKLLNKSQLSEEQKQLLEEKGLLFNLSIMQNDDPTKSVEGKQNIQFYIKSDTTVKQIAKIFNDQLETLGFELTEQFNEPPIQQDQDQDYKKQYEEKYSDRNDREQINHNDVYEGGKGIYKLFNGIPYNYFKDFNNVMETMLQFIKKSQELNQKQKKQAINMLQNQDIDAIIKKLKSDQKAGKMWQIILSNLGDLEKIKIID